MRPIKIIIVEDSEIIRTGLKQIISGTDGFHCVGDFESCESMFEVIQSLDSDIILMDIGLPGISGIEGIKKLREINYKASIIILTIHEDSEYLFKALCEGAVGYILKKTPPAKILEYIVEAFNGGAPMNAIIARKVVEHFQNEKKEKILHKVLSPREKEVLSLLVDGYNYKAMSEKLFISVDTVQFHFRNIYKKLNVNSHSQLVALAIKEELI